MESRTYLMLNHVLIWVLQVSSKCTSFDMREHSSASMENTQTQSIKKEIIFPKSCGAACVDRDWCLGVTVDKESRMCIFQFEDDDDRCPSVASREFGQTLYLKQNYNSACLSVGFVIEIYIASNTVHHVINGVSLPIYI